MGNVYVLNHTPLLPITMIGEMSGVCVGADVSDQKKNFLRGLDCLNSEHGRTFEFPDVYLNIDGYSARVMREWYTHIGGSPTRLQASTRYIDYEHGFRYVTPKTIRNDIEASVIYKAAMENIMASMQMLDELGIAREDSAMLLPLGMETKVVCKHNLRNLIDMSHQRMCTRAYHEYREDLFSDLMNALSKYSDEWRYLVENFFKPKCEITGFCTEKKSCNRKPRKAESE